MGKVEGGRNGQALLPPPAASLQALISPFREPQDGLGWKRLKDHLIHPPAMEGTLSPAQVLIICSFSSSLAGPGAGSSLCSGGSFLVFSASVEITLLAGASPAPPESPTELCQHSSCPGPAPNMLLGGGEGVRIVYNPNPEGWRSGKHSFFRGFSENNAWKVELNCYYRSSNLIFF